MKLPGIPGESTDIHNSDIGQFSTTTVQLGENNLGQVASRLGFHKDDPLAANPHISDPSNLKVGQETHLPTHPVSKGESSAASPSTDFHANELPKAPIGDSLEASLLKHSLDMASKEARLHGENAEIGDQIKQADQKYQNAMESATTAAVLGVTASSPTGDVFTFMIEEQKMLEKEARADHKEQRNDEAVQQNANDNSNNLAERIRTKRSPY